MDSKCNYTQKHMHSLSFGYFVSDCGNTHRCYYNQYIKKTKNGHRMIKKSKKTIFKSECTNSLTTTCMS